MSTTTKGVTFFAAEPKESTQRLDSLEPGNAFRLPDVSWADACRGDTPGGCFYWVLDIKKDGLVGVVSFDFKVKRKLPEETSVIQHTVQVGIIQNRD